MIPVSLISSRLKGLRCSAAHPFLVTTFAATLGTEGHC